MVWSGHNFTHVTTARCHAMHKFVTWSGHQNYDWTYVYKISFKSSLRVYKVGARVMVHQKHGHVDVYMTYEKTLRSHVRTITHATAGCRVRLPCEISVYMQAHFCLPDLLSLRLIVLCVDVLITRHADISTTSWLLFMRRMAFTFFRSCGVN